MFPSDSPSTAAAGSPSGVVPAFQRQPQENTEYSQLMAEFVGEVRSQLSTLTGEIALRNKVIQENDAYIYDDLLTRMIDIPVGHDNTPVNWLRRTVEIHRAQFMGKGFTVTSSYQISDDSSPPDLIPQGQQDPNAQQQSQMEQQMIDLQNQKNKGFAESRRQLVDAIFRDNNALELFAEAAENASAVGDSVMKGWYDEVKGKYCLSLVEATEHIYALWSKDDFRTYDMIAYVYQVSKQEAKRLYGVGEDVATSPLGMPLAVLSSANTVEYISTQPMVTIMEITGKAQGWGTDGNQQLKRKFIGDENTINAVIVGNSVYRIIDDPKKIPHYYILPNKRQRRRPWGQPDISKAAIQINLTYVETLSDWRTLASKVNFPKFKAINFPTGTQMPKFKSRTAEMLPLPEGKDIQPLNMPNSAGLGEQDFIRQMQELESQFVRETGISRNLFDMPDAQDSDSNQAVISAMKSISDLTGTKRQLWEPIIIQICKDALKTLAEYDTSIKELEADDQDWYFRIEWPSPLNSEDPVYQTMLMNRFNSNTISLQTFLERQGETKEELDRLKDELNDPVVSAIHGRMLGALAEFKFFPPGTTPPKVNVNLRGDLTPEQEGNITAMHGMNDGPFPPTIGPQGNSGLTATDNSVNQGLVSGQQANSSQAVQQGPDGQPVSYQQANAAAGNGQQPEPVNGTPANNTPGSQPTSQPGSGAPATSAQGKTNQKNQRKGK